MKKSIFLVAGCPSTDVHAAQFMRKMRALNPAQNYDFFGIGGPEMQREGFESIGVESKQFRYKPFFPWKNFRWITIEAYTHPIHAYTHYVNWRVFKQLRPKYSDILQRKPSAFVTFENQFFMKYFYKEIRQQAENDGLITAPTFYWGLTHINELHHHQTWLDHFFTRLPNKPNHWSKFEFPNTQVGWDGLFRAYVHLFRRSDNYGALTLQEDHLYLPAQHHKFPLNQLITNLVEVERNKYRESHQIGDQDTVLFLAIGNTKHEIEWSIQKAQQSIDQLFKLNEMQNIPKDSFKLIISVPPEEHLQKDINKSLAKANWQVKMTLVKDEESKFAAMCASDIALAVNGQIVAECAGLQLPTIVLDPQPFFNSYSRSLWNSFSLDLNIAIRGVAYPELLGQSIPMKIALTIQEIYSDPKLRYYYINRYDQMLRDSLCPTDLPPNNQQQQAFSQTELVGYQSGTTAMAHTVSKAADVFTQLDHNIPSHQKHSERVKVLKSLGWAKGVY